MAARVKRSDVELQQDSLTVLYEFDALCRTAMNLRREEVTKDRVLSNAHVESFGIHCRAMTCFLFGHDPRLKLIERQTDLLALHYFLDDSTRWTSSCPSLEQLLIEAKVQADKQVAHLTVYRRGVNQSPHLLAEWRIGDTLISLTSAMSHFVDAVPKSRLAPNVEGDLRKLINEIRYAFGDWPATTVCCQSPGEATPATVSMTARTQPDNRPLGPPFGMAGKTE